jgi:glycosyltransferase involved in cell wall biosynthesis
MLDSLTSNYGVALPSPHLIHNGLQMPEINFAPKRPMILAAGRIWDQSKNFSVLDDVAGSLQWPIRIAGASESPDGRRSALAHAQFLGDLPQSALHRMMCDAAIFAHPALYEPFGLAILEAAQRGCALVLSDIPSLRELWEDAAVFCPPRDHQAWVTALETISNSENLHSELSVRARSRAAQFTTEQMVDGYQRLYTSVITGRRREMHWERAS